jgi:hypothetical protein
MRVRPRGCFGVPGPFVCRRHRDLLQRQQIDAEVAEGHRESAERSTLSVSRGERLTASSGLHRRSVRRHPHPQKGGLNRSVQQWLLTLRRAFSSVAFAGDAC